MTMQETQIKLSVFELAQKLIRGETIELSAEEQLVVSQIDMVDFMAIVNEEDLSKKLGLLQQSLMKYGIAIFMEGAVSLGMLNLDDRSWTITAGEGQKLKVLARALPLRLALNDLVSFLKKLPLGQALALNVHQDLSITGLTEQAVMNYYELSQSNQDASVIEKTQDQFFIASSEVLRNEGLALKIYAMDSAFLNREVNPSFGQISFRPVGNETLVTPRIIAALVKQA